MALTVKDELAMRLTKLGPRMALALAATAWAGAAGCRRSPYIDQTKVVPHEAPGRVAEEDAAVKRTNFFSGLPLPLPRVAPPRTTEKPEAQELWPLRLEDAIRIALDNAEVIRVIPLGAQGIPIGGFEPAQLQTTTTTTLGSGSLASVYDPAIQETQIAQALSTFDAQFQTTLFWGKNVAPVNNAISAGTFSTTAARFPVVFAQDTAQFATTLQKRTAIGSILSVAHNVNYIWSNSPINVFPSAYTTNTQLRLTQPLLGGTAQAPSGLEANRAPIVIARLNADAAVWGFKAEVMAMVRSVEQQYWALAQQHVQLWSRETAVELGEEILRKELASFDVGRGTEADVAEARQQLEQFRLDLVTATSDVTTTERQLRNIMGLPPADNRRIVPVTAPTEARLEPDWDTSLAQMVAFHPDIVRQQLLVRLAELQLLVARNQLLPVLNLDFLYQFNGLGNNLDSAEAVMTGGGLNVIDPLVAARQRASGLLANPQFQKDFQTWQVGFTFQMPLGFRGPLANTRQAQYFLLRQRAFLQQVVHQTTHSLARFFLEVDANYKQFKTASRLRAAAAQRLEAAQANYEVGKITLDRYLDALSQWARAVALEAQFKTSYNTSIVALEESKGTLLAYDNIAVAEGPWPAKAYIQARDQQAAHRQLPIGPNGPLHPTPVQTPEQLDPVVPMPPPAQPAPGPIPPMPAPIGPLGPPPEPAPPTVPTGEPNHLSRQAPGSPPWADPSIVRAGATAPAPGPALPPPAEDLPMLPTMELPPLPRE